MLYVKAVSRNLRSTRRIKYSPKNLRFSRGSKYFPQVGNMVPRCTMYMFLSLKCCPDPECYRQALNVESDSKTYTKIIFGSRNSKFRIHNPKLTAKTLEGDEIMHKSTNCILTKWKWFEIAIFSLHLTPHTKMCRWCQIFFFLN